MWSLNILIGDNKSSLSRWKKLAVIHPSALKTGLQPHLSTGLCSMVDQHRHGFPALFNTSCSQRLHRLYNPTKSSEI